MARGSNQATAAGNTAQGFATGQEAKGNSLFNVLAPELLSESANPPGIAPADLARMTTANEESAGGSEAAAVGQGALKAARTRNIGGSDAAIGEGVRAAGENLSRGALSTQLANARMKEAQRRAAMGGLEGLYGMTSGEVVPSINAVSNAANANTNAANASWDWAKYILDPAMAGASQGAGLAMSGCWIAEAIYGQDDKRTQIIRAWLNGPFRETVSGKAIMWLYLKIGRKLAQLVRRSIILRNLLKPLFDMALAKAMT